MKNKKYGFLELIFWICLAVGAIALAATQNSGGAL